MEVAISALRADLKHYVARAKDGEDVIVTERGVPVARLAGIDHAPLLERLAREGVISAPLSTERPRLAGRARPRSRRPVSDIVSEQRGH